MIYVALLRGINVGGNSRVEMQKLSSTFRELGFSKVKTYINSGNVIFETTNQSTKALASKIEKAIVDDFGFIVHVVVRDYTNIKALVRTIPETWVNNQDMRCDVMFLWDDVDTPKTLNQLTVKPDIEDVKYMSGAIIWRVDRKNVGKSGMLKIIGTPLYKKMTIRNCNTVRKLEVMMREIPTN